MTDTISTLIALVGFLIVFSMLAQSVQEALKSVLNLKAGVWERFFLSLYKREFLLGKQNTNGKEPAGPTSVWKREFVGDFDSRLKRLKDVVVSADDLLQAVKSLLYEIATIPPGNPFDSNTLVPKLRDLATKLKELTGLKLDALLSIYDRMDAETIKGLTGALQSFEKLYPDLGYSVNQFDIKAFAALQNDCKQLLAAITTAEKKVSDYRQQIECKIDSWIAQVNEEYRRNMLKWTVITGFLLVLLFNADAFVIYKYLNTNPKVQAAVVSQAQDAATKVLTSSVEDLNKINDLIKKQQLKEAQTVMTQFAQRLENDFTMLKDDENAKKMSDIKGKLSQQSKPEDEKRQLNDQAGELARQFALLTNTAINYHIQGMDALGLPLGWTEAWKRFTSTPWGWEMSFLDFLSKVGGLLLTTFLITFGAPFWNDILTALVGFKNSMKMKS
jgi:cell division septum initiation protein DivIVA